MTHTETHILIENRLIFICIQYPAALARVADELHSEMLQDEQNRHVMETLLRMEAHNEPVTMLTLMDQLQHTGHPVALSRYTDGMSDLRPIDYYIRAIREAWERRSLATAAQALSDSATNPEVPLDEARSRFEQTLLQLDPVSTPHRPEDIDHILSAIADQPDEAGVQVGLPTLDKLTGGLHAGELTILAARPAVGKSALALTMALQASVPTVLYSLEMSKRQIARRAARMRQYLPHLTNRVLIDDTGALTIAQLRRSARQMVQHEGVGLIIVDYLQLMVGERTRNSNREQEVASVSRALKALAMELGVPVIALAQLNRNLEQRKENRRPMLSDLRESGAIEQDADIVTFIHRPQDWNADVHPEAPAPTTPAQLIVAKHRNGETRDINLRFHRASTTFVEQINSISL